MNQPKPYTHTNPMGGALIVGFIRMVGYEGLHVDSVAFTVINDPDTATAYVPLNDLDQFVAAIYTAAGRTPPCLDPIQKCDTCGAGYTLGQPCQTCAFNARMAAEQAAR